MGAGRCTAVNWFLRWLQSTPRPHFFQIMFMFFHLTLGLPSGSCLQISLPKPACISLLPHTCHVPSPSDPPSLERRIFGEEYRWWSSSVRSFLQSPVTSSLLAQIFSSAPYSRTHSACVLPLMWQTKFPTQTKQQTDSCITLSIVRTVYMYADTNTDLPPPLAASRTKY